MARKVGTRKADTLQGTDTNDVLLGRAGDDMLYGLAGDDQLSGEAGDDTLSGGSGTNTLDGGDGFDTADYSAAATAVYVNLTDGVATAVDRSDSLIAVERVLGSAFADTIAGSAGNDTLEGAAGSDTMYSGGGDDILIGGAGDDTMFSSGGTTLLDGGDGLDTASFFFARAAVSIDLRISGPQSIGLPGTVTFQGIEWLGGSRFDDTLIGNAGLNLFFSSDGSDTIDGGDGYDVLFYTYDSAPIVADFRKGFVDGSAGRDTFTNIEKVIGTNFDDTFNGNGAANQFQGANGADMITTGKGADFVIINTVGESNTITGADRITDLAREDHLYFLVIDADTTTEGDQAFSIARAFTGVAGQMTVKYDAGTNLTTIAGDVNGDGMADLTVFCDGNVTRFVDSWVL